MLTILHTESSLGWGGQENRTLHECIGLKRRGARPVLLCKPGSRLGERAGAAGIEVLRHPMRSNRDISAVVHIMRLIKRESVDVVVTHSGDDSLLSAIAGRLSWRRPAIVRTRHIALPITSKATYSILPHRVVAVSEHVRRYLVEGKGIKSDKVVSIPTGIDLGRFDPDNTSAAPRVELGAGPEGLIVGMVAILRRKKGHHVILDAIPGVLMEAPGTIFVFAGEGPQRENIESKVRELGIGNSVRLLGLRADIPSILKSIDLFVLPTLEEALGTSILEAAAMRKAVVAACVGGVPEVVRDGVTGLLVPPEDPLALAGAITRLLKDKGLRDSMGMEGRRMVELEYSFDVMADRLFEFYGSLADKRGQGFPKPA